MDAFEVLIEPISKLDWFALVVFLICWKVYGFVVDGAAQISEKGLVRRTHRYRELWARELINRSNRVSDTALLSNLIHSASFYANTTIYILAGLFALLGALEKVLFLTADFVFTDGMTKNEMEIKLILVLIVFVVAYFKFTWSLRQFNVLSILVGAAPSADANPEYIASYIRRMARINSLAGDEFNRGIRAYYFAIASASWMLSPWALIMASLFIVGVLIRRDFYSNALAVLSKEAERCAQRR